MDTRPYAEPGPWSLVPGPWSLIQRIWHGKAQAQDRIGVMREVNGKMVIHYLDPRSVDIFDDEFFLLQQNDIIFTEVGTRRFLKESYSNWTWFLSALTSLGTLYTMYKTIESIRNNPNNSH